MGTSDLFVLLISFKILFFNNSQNNRFIKFNIINIWIIQIFRLGSKGLWGRGGCGSWGMWGVGEERVERGLKRPYNIPCCKAVLIRQSILQLDRPSDGTSFVIGKMRLWSLRESRFLSIIKKSAFSVFQFLSDYQIMLRYHVFFSTTKKIGYPRKNHYQVYWLNLLRCIISNLCLKKIILQSYT